MTIEKISDFVSLKFNNWVTHYNEVAEYRQAIEENRKVFEPSKIELVLFLLLTSNLLPIYYLRKNGWKFMIHHWVYSWIMLKSSSSLDSLPSLFQHVRS